MYGTDFEILTDHKPLEFIYSRKSHPSARVRHIPGKENIADTLSRLTEQHTKSCEKLCAETEEYVRFVAVRVPYPLERLNVPQQLTKNCPILENAFRRDSGKHLKTSGGVNFLSLGN